MDYQGTSWIMPDVTLRPGDCLDVMMDMALEGEVFDAVVCDPPYHLTSTVKRFGSATAAPAKHGTDGAFARASRGFMGKTWDGGDIAFRPETWRLCWEVLKPGAHMAVFGGTRTWHRIAVAIEDAGFEIRDNLAWIYGTGFPKSHDVSKGIDKALGAEREVIGSVERSAVRPAVEGQSGGKAYRLNGDADITTPGSPEAAEWQGWGTALKPAFEPIILARKPLIGTVAANVLEHRTGALNIGGCRIGTEVRHAAFTSLAPCSGNRLGDADTAAARRGTQGEAKEYVGRWPANVLHDGSDEVEAMFAAYGEKKAGNLEPHHNLKASENGSMGGANYARSPRQHFGGDSGTASRFFYSAKASAADRAGSKHPTVKPQALMRWLLTLMTPPGGRVLDPFCGSGSTLQAAHDCGFRAVGIERETEYQADILRRLAAIEMEALA